MLFAGAHKSALHKKWHVLVNLDQLALFNHHTIALVLLYNMTNFFHRAVPELHDIQNLENSVQVCGVKFEVVKQQMSSD